MQKYQVDGGCNVRGCNATTLTDPPQVESDDARLPWPDASLGGQAERTVGHGPRARPRFLRGLLLGAYVSTAATSLLFGGVTKPTLSPDSAKEPRRRGGEGVMLPFACVGVARAYKRLCFRLGPRVVQRCACLAR